MMSHITVEALKEAYPNIRPYTITRAGFAGFQRYASSWSGDNVTSWKTIKFNLATMLNIGLSGVANYGSDIGGFWGPAPSGELLARWVQNGVFHPRFSIHSCNSDNTVTEPWMHPQYTHYIRQAMELRGRLLPYLYSLLYESSTIGSPIIRPLLYHFQHDDCVYDEYETFMLGPYLLVSTVIHPLEEAPTKQIYFPTGCSWYKWGQSREKVQGGSTVTIKNLTLESVPLFFRDRAVIPTESASKR